MKIFTFLFFVSILCIFACKDEASNGGTCSFTVSGDHSGTYTGDAALVESGYNNYICDSNADGLVNSYPQVTVSILSSEFIGAGNYNLDLDLNKRIIFSSDQSTFYRSDGTGSTTDCEAVFSSETEATFKCTDVPKESGGGVVTISSGSFSL